VQPASSQTRAAQARELHTRTLANLLYSIASKFIWVLAVLLVIQEFGVNVIPVVLAVGLIAVALAFGAQNFLRDLISGFYVVWEDQYLVGDTIQVGETVGRVEHLTLRRTLIRDSRGALVTLSNGDIRTVSNLSRDWSQTFVDVAVSPQVPQERAIQALDAAAVELRKDPSWSQALLDGPRILGLQSYDQNVSTIRMQVRTAPSRQDDVARELRRRIQLEFQRQGIALSNVQRIELIHSPGVPSPGTPVSSA
jgi:small conductance mechanosensitive channel